MNGCAKTRYRSRSAAADALLQCRIRAELNNHPARREKRYYHCHHCNGWHLTSKDHNGEQAA